MKIKLNVDLLGKKAGTVVEVSDTNGVPDELFWRRRLRDAAIDNCCQIVTDEVVINAD